VVYLTTLVQVYIVIDIVYLEYLETKGRVTFIEVRFGIGKWMELAQDHVRLQVLEMLQFRILGDCSSERRIKCSTVSCPSLYYISGKSTIQILSRDI
jgi:hypothetical protein